MGSKAGLGQKAKLLVDVSLDMKQKFLCEGVGLLCLRALFPGESHTLEEEEFLVHALG